MDCQTPLMILSFNLWKIYTKTANNICYYIHLLLNGSPLYAKSFPRKFASTKLNYVMLYIYTRNGRKMYSKIPIVIFLFVSLLLSFSLEFISSAFVRKECLIHRKVHCFVYKTCMILS